MSFSIKLPKNPISSILETVTHLADNRNARTMNRDNLQAAVMAQTGLNTQADKLATMSSLSKDGAATHANLGWSASAMLSNMFGGKGGGIMSMFKSSSTTSGDGTTSNTSSGMKVKWPLIIVGSILTFFGLRKLFGKKGKRKKRR